MSENPDHTCEPVLAVPVDFIYHVLDSILEPMKMTGAAEALCMDFIKERCFCGQEHDPKDIPPGALADAQESIDETIEAVDMVRRRFEEAITYMLDRGKVDKVGRHGNGDHN